MIAWRLVCGVLGLLLPLVAAGQVTPAAGWQPEEALRYLMLRSLTQTPAGLVWAGTDEGVYRFDGTQVVALNALRRRGPALPPVPCNALLVTPDGYLWLGTDNGLYRFSPTGTLHQLPLPVPASATPEVPALALAADGRRVWVSQGSTALQAYTLAGQPTGPVLASLPALNNIYPAPDGSLWLSSQHGRTRHLAATGPVLGTWNHPGRWLRPLLDPAGRPWLLSDRAAYRPGPAGQLIESLCWEQPGTEKIVDLLPTPGAPTLLSQQLVRQLEWTPGPDPRPRVRFTIALPAWPTANWSGRLWADHSGHWWVFDTGTRGCWHREATPVFIRALSGPGGQPYSVRASVRLPDGRLLVSTYGGLLTQAADSPLAPLRRWAAARLPQGRAPVLMGIVPRPLGPQGDWLAGGVAPFLRFNPGTGQFRELPVAGAVQTTAGVLGLTYDAATGAVWGAARTGLYQYNTGLQIFTPFLPAAWPARRPPPFRGSIVEAVCPEGRGNLWLATPKGVERVRLATGARVLYGPTEPAPRRADVEGARCLYLAPGGRLWVGTRTHGLAVVEPNGTIHAALTPSQGLPSPSVASILPGPGGFLWLGTYQGLVRYQPATGQLLVFTTAQGLASDEFNASAAYVDPRDNSLLMGGVGGLHRIAPRQVPSASPERPRLLLTALTALSASAEASRTHYLLASEAQPALRLAPDRPIIDLHLALPNSPDAHRARYAYRVRGWLADRWLGLGTTPRLRLQGLPPGQYTVEIRAASSQGVPAANVLRLPLTVSTVWWNRPGVWLLAALAAIGAVYGWQRGRLRRVQHDNELRTKLAADLHDEVGSLLTRINFQAQLLRDHHHYPAASDSDNSVGFERLLTNSAAAVQTMRDVVWSIDARADSAGALLDRMRDYLDQLGGFVGPALTLHTAGLPDELALAPALRQQLYFIFKEAITNAVRHAASANEIQVSLVRVGGVLELEILDDGPYQVPAGTAPRPSGLGLRNMAQRAKAIGGELRTGGRPDSQPGFRVWVRV
jgi:signal transduction histidine kinase